MQDKFKISKCLFNTNDFEKYIANIIIFFIIKFFARSYNFHINFENRLFSLIIFLSFTSFIPIIISMSLKTIDSKIIKFIYNIFGRIFETTISLSFLLLLQAIVSINIDNYATIVVLVFVLFMALKCISSYMDYYYKK